MTKNEALISLERVEIFLRELESHEAFTGSQLYRLKSESRV